MVQEQPSDRNGKESSEPTNPILEEKIQQGLERQAQNQEGIMSSLLQPGYELGKEKYIFQSKLGEGGFGITFLAEDKKSCKQVVIKTLNEQMRRRANFRYFREKFNNEAVKLAQCNHPHIVKLMDEIIYDESEWPYLVMEYIAGKNLERYIKEDYGFLLQKEALDYALQIADALKMVHQMNLFHLDVNPRNIIIKNDSKEAVLIDFGTSRRADADLKSVINEFISLSYAPIERYRQEEQGAYTDVYGLSATLYFMLTGKDPEEAGTRERLINWGRPDPLIAPNNLCKNSSEKIEEKVEQAILWGLALEPKDRPQTIEEWLVALLPNTNIDTPPITRKNNSNKLELLGRAAFMGVAIWLLFISFLKLIVNSNISYVLSLLLCVLFIFISQYSLPNSKSKSYLFISAGISTLLIFIVIVLHIIPDVRLDNLTKLPRTYGFLTIGAGFVALIVMAALKKFFIESDNAS